LKACSVGTVLSPQATIASSVPVTATGTIFERKTAMVALATSCRVEGSPMFA